MTTTIWTVEPVTKPGVTLDGASDILDHLIADATALGPALSVSPDGRVTALFQVEAASLPAAQKLGMRLMRQALGPRGPQVAGLSVWEGEADARPHGYPEPTPAVEA